MRFWQWVRDYEDAMTIIRAVAKAPYSPMVAEFLVNDATVEAAKDLLSRVEKTPKSE